jgi:hypothetical protein
VCPTPGRSCPPSATVQAPSCPCHTFQFGARPRALAQALSSTTLLTNSVPLRVAVCCHVSRLNAGSCARVPLSASTARTYSLHVPAMHGSKGVGGNSPLHLMSCTTHEQAPACYACTRCPILAACTDLCRCYQPTTCNSRKARGRRSVVVASCNTQSAPAAQPCNFHPPHI